MLSKFLISIFIIIIKKLNSILSFYENYKNAYNLTIKNEYSLSLISKYLKGPIEKNSLPNFTSLLYTMKCGFWQKLDKNQCLGPSYFFLAGLILYLAFKVISIKFEQKIWMFLLIYIWIISWFIPMKVI